MTYDILFLHPPSSFNKITDPLAGAFPSEAGESDLFICSPYGVNALYHRLKSRGFTPGFLNLGRLQQQAVDRDQPFHVKQILRDSPANGFGIDLHWAVHTPGALDLARMVKEMYPGAFVFLGGLTATYYYREILTAYPYIDAVMLGEADEAIVPLAEMLQKNQNQRHFEGVPNLAFRSGKDPAITVNPVRTPVNTPDISYQNVESGLAGGYLGIKGCTLDCPHCGGSRSSYRSFFYRQHPLALDPVQLIREFEAFEKNNVERVFLMNDIRIMGKDYVKRFFKELNKKKLNIQILQELFWPAEPAYLEQWKKSTSSCLLLLALASDDSKVLKKIGRGYSNEDLRETVETCSRLELPLELFSLFPLPGQDVEVIRSTMDFIEEVTAYPHIDFAIESLSYVSPGSPIFENPEEWGYTIQCRSVKDLREYLDKPHWSQGLGFFTRWLSREEFIDMVFYVAERTNQIRLKKDPTMAPLYLLNFESQQVHRKLVEEMRREQPVSDDRVREKIRELFPPHLLKDNRLLKYRFSRDLENPYAAFPYLSYLLLTVYKVPAPKLIQWFKEAALFPGQISVEEFKQTAGAPDVLKEQTTDLIGSSTNHIDADFIRRLIDFEWFNETAARARVENTTDGAGSAESTADVIQGNYGKYKLIRNETFALKTFPFDFDRVDWAAVSRGERVVPLETHYLYSLQTGKRKPVPPVICRLIAAADGTMPVKEIVSAVRESGQESDIAIAITLGVLVKEGILLPRL